MLVMSKHLESTGKNKVDKSTKGSFDILKLNTAALANVLSELEIPRLFYQLVVFVLDGSGSMTYNGMTGRSKGEEVEKSVRKVIQRLRNSKNKNSFDINIWAYANESVEMLPITPVQSIKNDLSLNPCNYIEKYNGTNLMLTLKSVRELCQNYLIDNSDKNAQALVVILSDGALDEYEESIKICNKLKEQRGVSISSIFFESKTWQENYLVEDEETLKNNMKNLATDASLFTSTLDPEEIRKHMIKSISTVSKID